MARHHVTGWRETQRRYYREARRRAFRRDLASVADLLALALAGLALAAWAVSEVSR